MSLCNHAINLNLESISRPPLEKKNIKLWADCFAFHTLFWHTSMNEVDAGKARHLFDTYQRS
jgi:hypothetical protein